MRKAIYAVLIICIINCGGWPNYIPPVSYSYYPDEKGSGNIGLSLLAGLYLSGSANIRDIILLTPNINFLGFDRMRIGLGFGKNFSLIKEKTTSISIIPSLFTNIINFKGEKNPVSPHIRGFELFPDIQFSFLFPYPYFEIYIGLKGILIPYAKVSWEESQTNEFPEETYSDPLQVFLPAVYGGFSVGKTVYINGGLTYLPTIFEEQLRISPEPIGLKSGLKRRLDIAPLTINLGLRFVI